MTVNESTYTSHHLKYNLQGRPLLYTSLLFFDIQLLSEEKYREKELWGSLSRKEPESDALMEYLSYILYRIHIAQFAYKLSPYLKRKSAKTASESSNAHTCEKLVEGFLLATLQ